MGKVKKTTKVIVAKKLQPKIIESKPPTVTKRVKSKTLGKHSPKLKVSNAQSGIRKIISKKEKQQMKRQKIKQKIELTKEAFKEDKAKQKRKKTVVVGDMKPLLDSLPSLDELLTLREKSNKTGITSIDRRIPKVPKSKKARRQLLLHDKTEKMLDRFDHVQKIWRNPEFQKDPRRLIAEQIKKRRQLVNEMET